MADYLVTLSASIEEEFGFTTILASLTGNGVATSSTSPLELNPGDRVGFRKFVYTLQGGQVPSNTATASGFASTHWTNTNNIALTTSYQYKTIKTGVSLTVSDGVLLTISSGSASDSDTTYYRGAAESPDTSITLGDTSIEIATTDTSFTQSISNESGTTSTNSSITEYRIKDAGTSHESRTGYGSITVTDVPPNSGFPKTYSVEARVTTANGGNGLFVNCPNTNFSVVATTTAGSNAPSLDNYGVALYDDQGDLITSFTSGHTVLRKIFATSSAVSLSTSTHTDVDTGLTGITTSNCVIAIDGDTTTTQNTLGSVRIPATFVTGGNGNIHVRVGRVTSAKSVNIEVLQHKGATIGGSSTNHGLIIKNGDDETVIDESSEVFSVREIIDINPSLSSQALYQNDESFFIYLELTQGRYPSADGPPIPALRCSSSVILIPPILTGVKHPDGSYKTVFMTFQKPISLSNYKLAMLVPGSASPEYYGGSASDYGLEINDSSGNTVWRSDYRQAIVNNVIAANQFTSGTNQNGNYDVTTGRDGVVAPISTVAEFPLALNSSDTSVSLTGLNEMDPANSFVAGALTAMSVEYYAGRHLDPEHDIDTHAGGGIHILGLRISSTTSASLTTYRFRGGSANGTNYGVRNPNSYHPEGHFVIFRIV